MIGSRRDWADLIGPEATDRVLGLLRPTLGRNTFPAVRLETNRLYIRHARPKDWKAWAALRRANREFLTPWEPTWPADAFSRRTFVRRLRRQLADWKADRGYSLLVFSRADDQLVGGVTLSAVRRGVAQMASMGYWVGEAFTRRGYMSEAAKSVLGFGFRQLGLHRIEAACLPNNEASRRLLLRVGFTEEGFAKAYLRINGSWRDHILFGMAREGFEALYPEPSGVSGVR
ncbi:MAG: GNAT family protein [Pseudomonadota bacterium]